MKEYLSDEMPDYFVELLEQHGSVDIANDELRKTLKEEPSLRAAYSEWCHAVGSSEKRGFLDFADEWLDAQLSKYDSLNDYVD